MFSSQVRIHGRCGPSVVMFMTNEGVDFQYSCSFPRKECTFSSHVRIQERGWLSIVMFVSTEGVDFFRRHARVK